MGMGPSPAVKPSSNRSSSQPSTLVHNTQSGSKQPLSIESLLAQQKAEKEAASKVCIIHLSILVLISFNHFKTLFSSYLITRLRVVA